MMHYAVHGHTAAELIVERANVDKEHKLGLVLKHVTSKIKLNHK